MTGIVVISGFTETIGEPTGSDAMRRSLEEEFDARPDVKVYDLQVWKSNPKRLASLMSRDGITSAVVIGYSWGGGYGSPRLCEALLKRSIAIPLVLLCDPVYRPQWLPAWGPANIFGFRGLIPNSATIKFPCGIGRLRGVRQKNNVPRGHEVQVGKRKPFKMTLVRGKNIDHQTIDSCKKWRKLVAVELDELLNQ